VILLIHPKQEKYTFYLRKTVYVTLSIQQCILLHTKINYGVGRDAMCLLQ